MNASDRRSLKALQEASIRGLNAQDYSPEQVEAILASQSCGSGNRWANIQYVAEYQTLLVGFVWLSKLGSVQGIFVHPDFAGCGLGRMLLQRAEAEFRPSHWGDRLSVIASLTAVEFYKKMGYSPIYNRAENRPNSMIRLEVEIPVMYMSKRFLVPVKTRRLQQWLTWVPVTAVTALLVVAIAL